MNDSPFAVPASNPRPLAALILYIIVTVIDLVRQAVRARSWAPFCRLVIAGVIIVVILALRAGVLDVVTLGLRR